MTENMLVSILILIAAVGILIELIRIKKHK